MKKKIECPGTWIKKKRQGKGGGIISIRLSKHILKLQKLKQHDVGAWLEKQMTKTE